MQVIIGVVAGAIVAAIFLGGVWIAATRAVSGGWGAVIFALSALIRVAFVAAAFVVLASMESVLALVSAFLTFAVVRSIAVERTRAALAGREA